MTYCSLQLMRLWHCWAWWKTVIRRQLLLNLIYSIAYPKADNPATFRLSLSLWCPARCRGGGYCLFHPVMLKLLQLVGNIWSCKLSRLLGLCKVIAFLHFVGNGLFQFESAQAFGMSQEAFSSITTKVLQTVLNRMLYTTSFSFHPIAAWMRCHMRWG